MKQPSIQMKKNALQKILKCTKHSGTKTLCNHKMTQFPYNIGQMAFKYS